MSILLAEFPLTHLRLWVPFAGPRAGVPITSYGYPGKIRGTLTAAGPNYEFYVDPDTDCWLTPEGQLLPISDTVITSKPCAPNLFNFLSSRNLSFTVVLDGRVQVNLKAPGDQGYSVLFYDSDELYVGGNAFEIEE